MSLRVQSSVVPAGVLVEDDRLYLTELYLKIDRSAIDVA